MERIITMTELRAKLACLIDSLDDERILIIKGGKPVAYLVSTEELTGMEETISVLSDNDQVKGIAESLKEG